MRLSRLFVFSLTLQFLDRFKTTLMFTPFSWQFFTLEAVNMSFVSAGPISISFSDEAKTIKALAQILQEANERANKKEAKEASDTRAEARDEPTDSGKEISKGTHSGDRTLL